MIKFGSGNEIGLMTSSPDQDRHAWRAYAAAALFLWTKSGVRETDENIAVNAGKLADLLLEEERKRR